MRRAIRYFIFKRSCGLMYFAVCGGEELILKGVNVDYDDDHVNAK